MTTCPMPFFPIYANELLADEDFQSWSPAERGCWLTLTARCWSDGSIPSNIERMAKLCSCNAEEMLKHWPSISSKFEESQTEGRLISRRIEKERLLAISKAEKISSRGKSGATARWAKEKEVMLKHCLSNAKGILDDGTSPSPSPSPSPLKIPLPLSQKSQDDCQGVVNSWNDKTAGKLPKAKLTSKRRKEIQLRLRESGWLEDFSLACDFLATSPFHQGKNDRGWVASLDFAIRAGKATELAEKHSSPKTQSIGSKIPAHRAQTDQAYLDQLQEEGKL